MEKIRLGIIGYGYMGGAHHANILRGDCPEITVTAAADIDPEKLTQAKKADSEIACFATAEELMDSGTVDAVLIAVPHYDHPRYAIEAMRRGLHVMVEKPAGVYTAQVREMNDAAKDANVVFGMMFNQRTNYIYRTMREIIQSGKYGELRRTNWIITDWYRPQAYYSSADWRATWSCEGGGVLLNQAPHQIDLWQWICGMPVRVSAKMQFGKWHDIEVEDDVSAYVEYENGATGVFVTTTGNPCGSNRFEVQLDGAKLLVENGQLHVWEVTPRESEFTKTNTAKWGCPPNRELELDLTPDNPQHVGVLNAFADAILHGGTLIADGAEGINALTLSNAMHLSAWTGETIDLPLDEQRYYDELMKRVAVSRKKPLSPAAMR